MLIGGLQKLSLIDYPGKVAAVIFTQGCNFRCPYCHNPQLVIPEQFQENLELDSIYQFLDERKDKLQGVVISGGEPTLQDGLLDFVERIKGMGYAVKIDTNGSSPHILRDLIEKQLVDYIAMDIKGPLERYADFAGVVVDPKAIKQSIDLISSSGIVCQFRTTVVKPLLEAGDLEQIVGLIKDSPNFNIQEFIPSEKIVDPGLLDKAHFSDEDIESLKKRFEKRIIV